MTICRGDAGDQVEAEVETRLASQNTDPDIDPPPPLSTGRKEWWRELAALQLPWLFPTEPTVRYRRWYDRRQCCDPSRLSSDMCASAEDFLGSKQPLQVFGLELCISYCRLPSCKCDGVLPHNNFPGPASPCVSRQLLPTTSLETTIYLLERLRAPKPCSKCTCTLDECMTHNSVQNAQSVTKPTSKWLVT